MVEYVAALCVSCVYPDVEYLTLLETDDDGDDAVEGQ